MRMLKAIFAIIVALIGIVTAVPLIKNAVVTMFYGDCRPWIDEKTGKLKGYACQRRDGSDYKVIEYNK